MSRTATGRRQRSLHCTGALSRGLLALLAAAPAACAGTDPAPGAGGTPGGGTGSVAGNSGTPGGGRSGSGGSPAHGGTAAAAGGTANVTAGTAGSGAFAGNAGAGASSSGGGSVGGTGGAMTAGAGVGAGGSGNAAAGGRAGAGAGGGAGGNAAAGGRSSGGRGGNSGAAGTTGAAGTSGGGVFSPCQFHFGTIDSIAKANPSLIPQLDFFTPGWMGQKDTFDMGYVCDEANPGGELAGKVPVIVAYVAAFYAKRHFGRCDCNVNTCGTNNDLCHDGAADVQGNLSAIVNVYKSYAQGFASCYGTTKPIVFAMEPDWYQYTISSQTQPMTATQAGSIMGQFVTAMKEFLPNARFSMDISPWVGANGTDNGADWYSHFDMSLFTFINTSGGSTQANATKIRSSNEMTWAGVSKVTGKPILADTGYGANGASAGHDPNWDTAANINARMADGVTSISQYNPASNWGSTISSVRSQLSVPKTCP